MRLSHVALVDDPPDQNCRVADFVDVTVGPLIEGSGFLGGRQRLFGIDPADHAYWSGHICRRRWKRMWRKDREGDFMTLRDTVDAGIPAYRIRTVDHDQQIVHVRVKRRKSRGFRRHLRRKGGKHA